MNGPIALLLIIGSMTLQSTATSTLTSSSAAETTTIAETTPEASDTSSQVIVSNPAGSFTQELGVLVLVGVNDIEMFSPEFALYAPPSYIDVWFDVPANRSAPTEPKLSLNFDYVHDPLVNIDLQLATNYTVRYDDMGEYIITATVSNIMDSKSFIRPLHIIDVLEGPEIKPAFPKAPKGQPLDVHFILYRGPSRPHCNLTWSFDDGQADRITDRTGTGQDGKDTLQVTYPALSSKTITVTATSPLEFVTVTKTIEVVEPVLDANLAVTVNNAHNAWGTVPEVSVSHTGIAPYDPFVQIEWGDGAVLTSLPLNTPTHVFSHPYTIDGQMTAKIIVFNDASSVERIIDIGVWKDFKDMAVQKCFIPDLPVGASCQQGLEPGQPDLFSSDKPVKFEIQTSNNAIASYYEIESTHTDGEVVVCNKTTNPFDLNFDKTGTWTVNVRAINPLYTQVVTSTVDLFERVVGFELNHNDTQRDGGVPKSFYPTFVKAGTFTCLSVDFGDDTSNSNSKVVYTATGTSCTMLPGYTQETLSVFPPSSIEHTYNKMGSYTITATAANAYSTDTQQRTFEITSLDCSQPQVVIDNSTTDFRLAREFKKGSPILICGIPRIACAVFNNVKTWTVEHVDEMWGNTTGTVDLTTHNVDTSTAELSLKPWTLEYGLYKVTFDMKMVGLGLEFRASTHSYIKVEKSDLVGLMVEGGTSEIVRGKSGGSLVLEPLKFSYDPDVVNNSAVNSYLNVVNWTCTFKNGSTATGCPTISSTSRSVSTVMGSLTAGEIYRFNVTLNKDTRFTVASVDVVVVNGDPPHITIKCTAGSVCHQLPNGYLVLKSARLGLSAECQNCLDLTPDVLDYNWNISLSSFRWPDGWRPLQQIDIEKDRTIGAKSKEISLQPSLFEAFKEFKLYKAKVSVTRTGVTGWAATHIKLNDPPTGGECSIEPKEHCYEHSCNASEKCLQDDLVNVSKCLRNDKYCKITRTLKDSTYHITAECVDDICYYQEFTDQGGQQISNCCKENLCNKESILHGSANKAWQGYFPYLLGSMTLIYYLVRY